jgi:VWFA-related protein
MILCGRGSFGILFCLFAVAPSAAETLPEARTEVVWLDAVVTDSHGTLVRDLEQKDFQVLEDKKAQVITNFAFAGSRTVSAPAGASPKAAPADATAAPAPAPGVTLGRNVLIIIDDLHISLGGLNQTRKALRRLVDELVAPDDSVAFVGTSPYGPAVNFSRDRAPLKAAIDRLTVQQVASPAAGGAQMTAVLAELILTGDPRALELAGRKRLADPGTQMHDGLASAARTDGSTGSDARLMGAQIEAKRQARGVLNEALVASVRSLRAIEGAVRSLGKLPGRKICLLVSDGFLVGAGTPEERPDEMRRIVDAATRSGAVVYSLDSRGLTTDTRDAEYVGDSIPPGLEESVARRANGVTRTTLTSIAAQTGGFLVSGSNDFVGGLKRMLEDSDAYYVLAYEPTNTRRDGRFRKIDVKIAGHPEYVVRTRKGYLAPDDKHGARPPVEIAAAPRPLTESEARTLLGHPPAGVSVRVDADYVELPPAGAQAIVRVQMPLSTLAWESGNGRKRASVEWISGVYDESGAPVGRPFSRRSDLELSASEYERAMSEGIRYQQSLPLKPGRYEVRVVARDDKGAPLGSARQAIEIPDLSQKKLALSGVFLSAGSGGEGLSDAQMLRRFKRGTTVYFQLYVYNPTADDGGVTDVVLQAQIRSSDTLVAASKPQPVTFALKDGTPVPQTHEMSLEGLAAGRYELRVVVFDRKANVSATRATDLTLD